MNKDIPKPVMERLAKHSEQFGITLDDLEVEMLEFLPLVEKENPELEVNKQIVLAYRKLKARLKAEEGGVGSMAIMHSAFFIGETGMKNTADQMIGKIKRMPEDEQKVFHPDDKTWLDYREGDNFGKPIEGRDHRTYYGVGSSGKEIAVDRTLFTKLDAWREAATSLSPKMNEVYTFRAMVRDSDKQLPFYDLNTSGVTTLRSSATQLSEDDKERLIRNCKKTIYNLSEIDMLYSTKFKDGGFDVDPVFVEADVNRIVYREDKQNIVGIDDELESGDYSSTAYFPHWLSIKFSEGDRVIFLGDLGETTSRGVTSTVLFTKGYFVLPASSKSIQFV